MSQSSKVIVKLFYYFFILCDGNSFSEFWFYLLSLMAVFLMSFQLLFCISLFNASLFFLLSQFQIFFFLLSRNCGVVPFGPFGPHCQNQVLVDDQWFLTRNISNWLIEPISRLGSGLVSNLSSLTPASQVNIII